MDSITQAALGASVGEALLGRRIGNRAPIWGAVLGTLPDLDVFFNPLMDEIAQLAWHRGPSHSILFAAVAAPLIGSLLGRMHRKYRVPPKLWTLFVFLCVVTHPLLDALTTYGTQLFWPFTDWPVAWPTISIVDPLYTLPLLVGVLGAMILRDPDRSRTWNRRGLAIATAYLLLTGVNKVIIEHRFRAALEARNIPYEQVMTTPSFFNSIMWHGLAADDRTVWVATISHLDDDRPIALLSIDKNRDLLRPYDSTEAVRKLLWFAQGFYRVRERNGEIHFDDFHVGQRDAFSGGAEADASVFSFRLLDHPSDNRIGFEQREPTEPGDFGNALEEFVDRVGGERYGWE